MRELNTRLKMSGNTVRDTGKTYGFYFEELLKDLIAAKNSAAKDVLTLSASRPLICRIIFESEKIFTSYATARKSNIFERDARRFTEENINRDIAVSELAEYFGLSVSRFSSRFKENTGQTPADFIRRIKCGKAEELLTESDLPVTRIAFRLGFSSSQYFASVFKKYTGMTPAEFRKKRAE